MRLCIAFTHSLRQAAVLRVYKVQGNTIMYTIYLFDNLYPCGIIELAKGTAQGKRALNTADMQTHRPTVEKKLSPTEKKLLDKIYPCGIMKVPKGSAKADSQRITAISRLTRQRQNPLSLTLKVITKKSLDKYILL